MIVRRLANEELASYGKRVAEYERRVTYPLGTDRFRIDHGADYFAFFRRLRRKPPRADDLRYYVVEDRERIQGVLAAVLREFPHAGEVRRSWYLCDLKAVGGARGVMAPLLRCFADDALATEPSAYAISMNRSDGTNPVVGVARRFAREQRFAADSLTIYSLSAAEIECARSVLDSRFGAFSFLSLHGVKDIVPESTGKPMALLHLQHGPAATHGPNEPVPGATHMFCLEAHDRTVRELSRLGVNLAASATLVTLGEFGPAASLVLTSDI